MNRYLIAELKDWIEAPDVPLLLYGAPGVGKKTLAIELLEMYGKSYHIMDPRLPITVRLQDYDVLVLVDVETMPPIPKRPVIIISTSKLSASQTVRCFRVLPRDYKSLCTYSGGDPRCYEVGGMPLVIYSWMGPPDTTALQYQRLLQYLFHPALKFALTVWEGIPYQLGRKFQYGLLQQEGRSKNFEGAIDWLIQNGFAYKVYRLRHLPKEGSKECDIDLRAFKLYSIDSGILRYMWAKDTRAQMAAALLLEQYILQELQHYPGIEIYYYTKPSSSYDVTFLCFYKGRWKAIGVRERINTNEKLFRSLPYEKLMMTPAMSFCRLGEFMQ